MFITRESIKELSSNEIYDFYHKKYYGLVDDEIFFLSGIGYIYKCLDSVVESVGFDKLCVDEGSLCVRCCQKQEAHVSLVEMWFFLEKNVDFLYNSIGEILIHAQEDPKTCQDLFFEEKCIIYPERFFICRAYANLFNGEKYCPRHNCEVVKGQAIDDIVDCFYYFIDSLEEINSEKYKGSITPTYFLLQQIWKMNHISENKSMIDFFIEHNLNQDWIKTYKPCRYSVGLLGNANYSQEYIDKVKSVSNELLGE